MCPSYVKSSIVTTTARFAASNAPKPQKGDYEVKEAPNLTEAESQEIKTELAGLAALVSAGMEPSDVAELTLRGLVEGKRYIYTNQEHTDAALKDRTTQLYAGGLPKEFKRQMEAVVEQALR